MRVTSAEVTFRRPFILTGFDDIQAAGSYTVDTEEKMIDGLSFPTWKRISTVILLKTLGDVEYMPIDSDELREALIRDGAQHYPALPPSPLSAKARHDRARGPNAVHLVRQTQF